MGLRAMRRGQQKDTIAVVVQPAESHDVPLARERRDRKAIGERFAESRQIRHDAIELLRAAEVRSTLGNIHVALHE